MSLEDTVLNAGVAAMTAKFDSVSLATGPLEEDEDTGIAAEALTWSSPSGGVSTASCSFTSIQGDWTHYLLWDSSTFVGSKPFTATVSFPVAADLTLAFQTAVEENA